MRKVGIVTLYGLKNYGNRLQAYALFNVLKKLNYNPVEICFARGVIPFIKDTAYSVHLSEHIKDPFNKYSIIEDLETIVEKGLCLPTSDLAKYPKDTINDVIMFYQYLREFVLDELENAYEKRYKK